VLGALRRLPGAPGPVRRYQTSDPGASPATVVTGVAEAGASGGYRHERATVSSAQMVLAAQVGATPSCGPTLAAHREAGILRVITWRISVAARSHEK
jgi:hypothetical protein